MTTLRILSIPILAAAMILVSRPAGAFCDPPPLDSPEEVLSSSVRLSWGGQSWRSYYEVQRWDPGSESWETVGYPDGDETSFTDDPPAPGSYDYRIRGRCWWWWGDYANFETLELPVECEGQPATDPALPVVQITDRDESGTYTGADVALALDECELQGGCVLEALPVTYDDVEIQLGTPAHCSDTAFCGGWDLPNGLVIQGHGSATVFRSPVFELNAEGFYNPTPMFKIYRADGDPNLDGIRFRNFTMDGRRSEQLYPETPSNTWRHDGIWVTSTWLAYTNGGCVYNVTIHDFLNKGVSLALADDWLVERNTIEEMGCDTEVLPCENFAGAPPVLPTLPTRQSNATGIAVGGRTDGTTVRYNSVADVTKHGISTFAGSNTPPAPGEEVLFPQHFHIHDNHLFGGTMSGISINGGLDGLVENNLSEEHRAFWMGDVEVAPGYNCAAWVERVTFRNNTARKNGRQGLHLSCTGRDLLVENNILEDNCQDGPASAGHLQLTHSTTYPDGTNALLLSNEITDDPSAGCPWTLMVGAGWDPVVVDGGTYTSGADARAALWAGGGEGAEILMLRNALFRNASFNADGATRTGLYFNSYVESAVVLESVFVDSAFDPRFIDLSENVVFCEEEEDPKPPACSQ